MRLTQDPVVFEVTTTLLEWHKIWLSLYIDNQTSIFDEVGSLICSLVDQRAKLISILKQSSSSQYTNNLVQHIAELKCDIVTKLDHGNRLLNLDLVPRDSSFTLVDPIELSPSKLYRLHEFAALKFASNSKNGTSNSSIDSSYDLSYIFSEYSSSKLSTSSIDSSSLNQLSSKLTHNIQLTIKNHHLVALAPDDLMEINFSIVDQTNNNNNYNGQNQGITYLTDKFLVQLQQDEIIYGVGSTIFSNLGQLSNRDICLYIQVYRIGKMILTGVGKQQSSHNLQVHNQDGSINSINSGKHIPNGLSRSRHSTIGLADTSPSYRRPFGATIVSLKEFIKNTSGQEHGIGIKIPALSESEFSQLHDLNSKRNNHLKINLNVPNIQLEVFVKLISCQKDMLPRTLSLSPCCLTESRGFPDIIMPGDFKNDLYLTLESAEFEKGGKSISKNIEASISLIDKSGLVIDGCISPGSNCDNLSSYRSGVFYHSNSPRWNESIKINVPLSEFESAHIRIEFRHCSTKEREKKFLGFAYLPLSDDNGTVIPDRSHELFIYKYDTQLLEDDTINLSKYTSLPYGPNAKNLSNLRSINNTFSHSSREVVVVNTSFISTKLTQNSDLMNLLRWRELVKRNNKDFEAALDKFKDIKGDEIVKFLQDILDTLFDTFTLYSTREDNHSGLIFKVLINIFLLLEKPEYQQFRPVLNAYVSNHFSATLVYKGLLACVKKCVECSTIVDRPEPIQNCFKTFKYIFHFIVQSKLLYSKATGELNDELFLDDLKHLFKLFDSMLACNDRELMPIQVTFLESFPGTIEHLMRVLSAPELAKWVTLLAGSVGFCLPPPLARAKLIFMREVVTSGLIKNQDVRLLVIENFCRHLDLYLKHSEELDLCHDVLEILVLKIHDYHWPSIHRLHQLTSKNGQLNLATHVHPVMTVGELNLPTVNRPPSQPSHLDLAIASLSKELDPLVNLMDSLLLLLDRLMQDFTYDRVIVQKYFTCLLIILKLMSSSGYEKFMKKRRVDYSRLCNLFRSSRSIYNRDWSVMQLTSHSILENPIKEIFRDIKMRTEGHSYARQLSSYINLIVDYITHPTLQLEMFSDKKKNYILAVFGDLRLKYAAQLVKFWNDLTKVNISDLIPTTIQPYLDASLLPSEELQNMVIPVFYDMIDAEDFIKSSSRQFERCLIDHLDLFMNLDRGNLKFIENFEKILRGLIIERSPSWEQKGLLMVDSFVELMNLLLCYRKSLENNESQSKRMSCLVELLDFYKDQDRFRDLHVRYIFKLCDMHLSLNNHVEAAFTLKLYSDEIRWSNRNLIPLEGYRPEEQEWKRKESLYNRIIHYFDQGKCWEEAIPLCKELASFNETFLVDYEKVSSILKRLAKFLDNILTEHRPEKEYFRVEFLGLDLPDFIRDKEFIYRSSAYERLPSFIEKMAIEFPDVTILNFKTRQGLKRGCPGKYLFVSTVKPVPFIPEQFTNGQRNINDKIIHYYMSNRVNTFSYDNPIIKGSAVSKDRPGDVNVRNLWVGRHILKTKNQLPHILPWSEVMSKEYVEKTPIENAIETVSSMNVELTKLLISYNNEPNKPIGQLTMRLQGVIEAPVNGGPSIFINAFLRRTDTEPDPNSDDESLRKLRELIEQQFSLLDAGLTLHAKLAPPEVMPLHSLLAKKFTDSMRPLLDNKVLESTPENLMTL